MSGDPKSPSQPQVLYQISGEMGQEFTALNLRDRIRNGTLTAQDQVAIVGTELWKSDGTPAGTFMLADLNPDGDSTPSDFVAYNGALYFNASIAPGQCRF